MRLDRERRRGLLSLTPASGDGSTTLTITAAANSSTGKRSGTLTIAGKTVTVTQEAATCSYDLSASGASLDADGSSGSFDVTSPTGCEWEASSDSNWIDVTSNASSSRANKATISGSGSVGYVVAANALLQARTGRVTVGDATFTVSQAAAICSFSISPTSVTAPGAGGQGTVSVTAVAQTGGDDSVCTWTVESNAAWIALSKNAGGASYTVGANGGAARSGTATIAERSFSVSQAAGGCAYSVGSARQDLAHGAATFTVAVDTQAGCSWTPVTTVSWLSTSEVASAGTGSFSVRSNSNLSSTVRQGTVLVQGAAAVTEAVAVTQAGTCTGWLDAPRRIRVGGEAGEFEFEFGVVVPDQCRWEVSLRFGARFFSMNPSSGTGSQRVRVSYGRHTGSGELSGYIGLSVDNQQQSSRINVLQLGGCRWALPLIEIPA